MSLLNQILIQKCVMFSQSKRKLKRCGAI